MLWLRPLRSLGGAQEAKHEGLRVEGLGGRGGLSDSQAVTASGGSASTLNLICSETPP